MHAPSALAADLPRSWRLTVALMQGETKAENMMLDDCGWYWRQQVDVVDDVGLDQPGWLSGWLADCPEWSGAGGGQHARLANAGKARFEGRQVCWRTAARPSALGRCGLFMTVRG